MHADFYLGFYARFAKKSEHKEKREREREKLTQRAQEHASCSSSSFEERWFCLWRSSGRVDVFFIGFFSSFSIGEYEYEKHV